MGLTETDAPATIDRRPARMPGPDVVRGVALIGVVVLNYHGYLVLAGAPRGGGWAAELFDPWTGPLSTRFAATFVLVAGVGVTLLTRSSAGDLERICEMRWRLVRRGVLLYVGGLFLDVVWPGTIIVYYGAMFVIAAGLFTLRSRWLVVIGVASVGAAWALRAWRYEQETKGVDTSWITRPDEGSPADYLFGVLVNGTHPLLPWLCFLCAGMLLGRTLGVTGWRTAVLGLGVSLVGAATLASATATTLRQQVLLSTDPGQRGAVYVASALGTALIAYATLDWSANRFPLATLPLRRAGQMSLSLYLGHIFVFELVVERWGWVEPTGLDTALVFALAYWTVGLTAATWWGARHGRGPAERLYRALTG